MENVSSSFNEIHLRWRPIPPNDVNGILLGYRIQYRLTGAAQWTQKDVSPIVLETNITNLSQYSDYNIRMSGYTSKGNGPASQILKVKSEGNVDFYFYLIGE